MRGNEMRVAVVNVINNEKKVTMNKDLNGGFGTADIRLDKGPARILGFIKKRSIQLPVVSLSFLMGIFKEKGIAAEYCDGKIPSQAPDIILIYGSIVDYKNENAACLALKERFKDAKVGFIGPFPSVRPQSFDSGDFVITGDFEHFFLKEFKNIEQLSGIVVASSRVDMDELPSPEVEGFPIERYNYSPAITKRPFFVLQSSRGCPYSCSYYCVYGKFQGSLVRTRSVEKVVGDMKYLNEKYGVKAFQFRDPTFGYKGGYIEELCGQIKKHGLKIEWGVETRPDILNKEKIKAMFDAGLRYVEMGVETNNTSIAGCNKRVLADARHQEDIVKYCKQLGIRTSALYLFGYEGDTAESMNATLQYAKRLDTFLARFAVCTPYPGTDYFNFMKSQDRILTHDYEKYTQFDLVARHDNFNEKDIRDMLLRAYSEYYFRPDYMLSFLKQSIKRYKR